MDAITVMKKIKKQAEKNSQRAKSQNTRFITDDILPIGSCIRQGDLYVFRMPDDFEVGVEIERNQIADGVSIGARHILNGDFKVYQGARKPPCLNDVHARISLGYAFDVKEGTVLGHPEHDNYVFKTSGRFQVVHQMDLRTLRKAAD